MCVYVCGFEEGCRMWGMCGCMWVRMVEFGVLASCRVCVECGVGGHYYVACFLAVVWMG